MGLLITMILGTLVLAVAVQPKTKEILFPSPQDPENPHNDDIDLDEFDDELDEEEWEYPEERYRNQWHGITVPNSRPEGNWVNWNYGSGWTRIWGTTYHSEGVDGLIDALSRYNSSTDTLRIELVREPATEVDENPIAVYAKCSNTPEAKFKIGYVRRDCSAWLNKHYRSDMPIAAHLVRLTYKGEYTSATICGLMPRKKERAQYELDVDGL